MTSKIYSPYFLALWKNEDKYSVIHRLSISDGTLRSKCDSKLLAMDNLEMLFNRRIYIGKLVYAGRSQKKVNMHLKTLEEVPVGNLVSKCTVNIEKSNRNKRKANERVSDIDKVIKQVSELEDSVSHSSSNSNVNSLPEFSVASTSVENSVGKDADEVTETKSLRKLGKRLEKAKRKISKLENELEIERDLAVKYKSKTKNLRRKLKRYQEDKQTLVDIGNGVMLNSALVERAKIFSFTPTILARNMFRLAFQDSEVRGKSLFGRSYNANGTLPPKPSVDSLKRDAVINYCISTLNEDAKRSHSPFFKSVIRERIVKSLGEYIREVATKIANRGYNNDAADNDD